MKYFVMCNVHYFHEGFNSHSYNHATKWMVIDDCRKGRDCLSAGESESGSPWGTAPSYIIRVRSQ